MKKLLLIVFTLGIATVGTAQMQGNLTHRVDPIETLKPFTSQNGEKASVEEWYNYVTELTNLGIGTNYYTVLFPDSMVKFEYSNGYHPVNYNSIGQVFDPKDPYWTSHTTPIDSNDAYKIDSIAIPYRYFRWQTGAADTMVVHVYKHLDLGDYTITSNSRRFKTADYDYMTFRGTNYSKRFIEVLDENDSTDTDKNYSKLKYFKVDFDVNPGEVVAWTMTYIPGNPYSEGDTIHSTNHTIGNKLNRFDVFYNSDGTQTYNDGYFNQGMVVQSPVRYNTGTSWDGIFISGIAYDNYLNMNSYFKVNAPEVGIEDSKELGFAVGQNSPNPFNNISFVEYKLEKASNVNIEVYDITGKSVMLINEGRKEAGSYRVEIDGSNLNAGVYYYSFRTDKGQITKKMMIQK